MTQVINTNSLSLLTQNNLNKSQSALNSAIERLSSGMRINSAKDDAAGQAIANRFTANIKGLTQATRNANDGISIAQTTEGALTEVNNNLQRIRELSVQAATGTNSSTDLDSIQSEIGQRLDEINRVSEQTQFNGVKVLSADAGKLTVQVGANDGETIDIDLQEISAKTLGLDGFNVNGTGTKNKTATSRTTCWSPASPSTAPRPTASRRSTTSRQPTRWPRARDVLAGCQNGWRLGRL
jgi:flagellin